MQPLVICEGLEIPAEDLAVSYTRDLGDDGGPEAARRTPTSVELRLHVSRCEVLDEVQRARILEHPQLRRAGRGIVRVVFSEFRSRSRNLDAARHLLATLVREAVEHRAPAQELVEPRRRRGGAGLIKRRREATGGNLASQ